MRRLDDFHLLPHCVLSLKSGNGVSWKSPTSGPCPGPRPCTSRPGGTSEYVGASSVLPPGLEPPACLNRALSDHERPQNLLPGAPGLTSFDSPSSPCPLPIPASPAYPQHWDTLGFHEMHEGNSHFPICCFSHDLISLSQQLCGMAALIPISRQANRLKRLKTHALGHTD